MCSAAFLKIFFYFLKVETKTNRHVPANINQARKLRELSLSPGFAPSYRERDYEHEDIKRTNVQDVNKTS
jgi:hypothetical protein